jgi:hypothetical protein
MHHIIFLFLFRPASFMDPKLHKAELQQRVRLLQPPPLCYLNLCGSSEVWSRVVNTLPEEAHAFKTKARVPTLLLFEMQDHPMGHDVATFLGGEVGAGVMTGAQDASAGGEWGGGGGGGGVQE